MLWKRLQLFFWYLLVTRMQADMFEITKFTTFVKTSDLKELCPNSNFCGQKASTPFQNSSVNRPCCLDCSCNPDCGLRGDCCSVQLDNYQTGAYNMICRHLFVIESATSSAIAQQILNQSPHFRMINKCSNSDVIKHACDKTSLDIEIPFQPVFSTSTKYIYVNPHCAMCNNVSDAVPLQTAITCLQYAEPLMSEFMTHFYQDSDVFSGCLIYYIPPTGILETLTCYPNVIRKCNSTGRLTVRDHFWDFCETFNATFTHQNPISTIAYGNVYCFLCNVQQSIKDFFISNDTKRVKCSKKEYEHDKTEFGDTRFTILLENIHLNKSLLARDDKKRLFCVQKRGKTKTCRPVRCPAGKLLIYNHCGYYSKQWTGGPFAVMLRLSPLRKDKVLNSSFFTKMSEEHISDSQAKWIKRSALKRWKLDVFYHLIENQALVQYIVVKAVFPSKSVNPNVLTMSVEKTLADTWEIIHKNSTFSFKVDLYEHVTFDRFGKDILSWTGIDITTDYGFFPKIVLCASELCNFKNHYDSLLSSVSIIRQEDLNEGIFITKLFFCSQIDLRPDEYIFNECGSIFFKIKNTTLYTFSKITLPEGQQSPTEFIKTSNGERSVVRICIEDYEQNGSVAIEVHLFIYGMYAMIFPFQKMIVFLNL